MTSCSNIIYIFTYLLNLAYFAGVLSIMWDKLGYKRVFVKKNVISHKPALHICINQVIEVNVCFSLNHCIFFYFICKTNFVSMHSFSGESRPTVTHFSLEHDAVPLVITGWCCSADIGLSIVFLGNSKWACPVCFERF